jgi:hypothetical protein
MKQRALVFSGVVILTEVLGLVWVSSGVMAQTGGDYDLSWWTVDGGGGTLTNDGIYTLSGTAGQPDAAVWLNGAYTLGGGFWRGTIGRYVVYLPLVLRQ